MSGSIPLRQQVGQLFVVGLSGPSLTDSERAWLRLLRPGGLILFRRNIEDAAQTTALLRDATQAASGAASTDEQIPVLRAVDLEGGLVDRLRDVLGATPSAAAVAATGKSRDAKRHGQLIGRATRLLGFNATFAPVLDLALPESEQVMRSRVASATAEQVVRYALPFFKALQAERVMGCGKHFPGLGGGTLDSHTAMPRIERSWEQLWEEDIAPYRELKRLMPLLMVAHAQYPRVPQGGNMPASVSRFWMTEVLRKMMAYRGLVLTDDMEMGGLLSRMSIEDAAVAAVLAGADLLEVCREPALILRAYEAVLGEAERSVPFRLQIKRICNRVVTHKQSLLNSLLPRAARSEQLVRLRTDLRMFATDLNAQEKVPAS